MKKILWPLLIIGLCTITYANRGAIHQWLDQGAAIAKLHKQPVVIYSTSWCHYCEKAKEFMENQGIEYFEYNIEESSKGYGQYRDLNGRGTPLLLVKGQVIRGYNPDAILHFMENS